MPLKHSYVSSSSSSSSSECESDLGMDDAEEASEYFPLRVNLTHTQSLILDYKQFKAARSIQRHIRGWLVRVRQRKALLAAVVVQKWWRRFQAQRNLLFVAENKLQVAVLSHYESCATLIQKVFRGWWSRKYIFDLTRLQSLQTLLAEDIIHCLSCYLRESKQKALLPGVHGALPRKCLQLTEQLMSTFGYRFYNAQACYKMQKTMAGIEDMRAAFKTSTVFTHIPFRGFDDNRACENRHSVLEQMNDPETFDLVQVFVAGQRNMDSKSNYKRLLALAQLAKEERQLEIQKQNRKRSFCKRIVLEMMNWRHADGNHILPRKIFSNKNKDMQTLLDEVKASLEDEFGQLEPCICGTNNVPSELAEN